jgi:glycosyltransferase involved in cell wall biosynthesis
VIAWFSPFPPVRSGIAAYSAELVPRLGAPFVIDTYPEHAAHDFVWRARRRPYDLVVYQLGNAPCHDYMWAYLARYPGLVVLHDARLHHARARHLLQHGRHDDYRREFSYDHPDADRVVTQYAIEGLGGPIYYLWPMLRVVMRTARQVAVHNARVAAELRDAYPDVPVSVIRMGVPKPEVDEGSRTAIRRSLALPDDAFVFAAFGKVTAEKRIAAMLRALAALVADGRDVYVLLVGDADGYPTLAADLSACGVADRVRVTGWIDDAAIGGYLGAADACLCLRWPTAEETSASWLRCLAAGRATVISDLAHLVDVPESVALRADLLEEAASLERAMRQLVDDPAARESIAREGHRYWSANHSLDAMIEDYRRVLPLAAAQPAPQPTDLPGHFTDDYSARARAILEQFGVPLDL